MLGEWLQQESIGAGVGSAWPGGENAHDEDEDVTGRAVGLELTTECEPIQLRDQDFAQDEIGLEHGNPGQCFLTVRRQLDPIPRLCEEVSGERADVRVTFDDEDGELGGRQQNTLDLLARYSNVRIRPFVASARRFAWTAFTGVRTTVA